MKIKLLCCLMVFLLALPVAALPPKDYVASSATIIDNTTLIDVNRILMFVTNHGNFGRDLGGFFGYDYGTWWPYSGDTAAIRGNIGKAGDFSPNYAAGLWIGAKVEGNTRVTISEYDSEYGPGPMVGGTFLPDDPTFRVYKLYSDSLASNPNQDYLDYLQYAVPEQGAPFIVTEDNDTIPDMIGDQMLWSVYNDANPAHHTNDAGETPPLGVEVKQTVFAFDYLGSLGDMVFVKYQIFNKGVNTLEECYFSIWFDPDLGGAGDDYVGCDTLTDLGFVYNADNSDTQYGVAPPAMGCDFFQGPLIEGDPADTARMWGQLWPGYKNMGLYSFNKYINGTDPDNFNESYGFMRGLTKDGSFYVYDGDTLTFVLSGDPVAGTGDLDVAPADRRWMQTTGPVTFAPGDSTELLIAMMVAKGSNNLTSVQVLKNLDVFAQKMYEEGFNPPKAPARPVVTVARLSGEITLSWGDTSEVDAGEFPFEGYSVWQGEGPSGPWQLLATYDVINDREDANNPLVDTLFDTESGLLLPVVMRSIKNTGLKYHYNTTMDALTNTRLKDLTPYYYRVTAFSFGYEKQDGSDVPNGDRFLESSRAVTVIPQSPLAGVAPQVESWYVIDSVDHATGLSGGVVEPIVIDPGALTGHDYRVTFTEVEGEIVWHLYDVTAGRWVLQNQTNQSGDDAYFVVDGLLVKVMGPAPGVTLFEVVANANGPLDPSEAGAAEWAEFPVPLDTEGNPLRPTVDQQATGDGLWLFHTANIESCSPAGAAYIYFDEWVARTIRNDNADRVGAYDYEMRFTGSNDDPEVNGSYAIEWFNDDNVFWVPFELWQIGIGTPDDPSDDVRLPIAIIDDYGVTWDGDDMYALESWGCEATGSGDWEHAVSGGDNDPFTDWVYWWLPADQTPGEAGYDACVADMQAGIFDGSLIEGELFARTVLVNWNGGIEPPFTMDVPEQGTVFRMTTAKPNFPSDTFYFSTAAPLLTATQSDLDQIKAVPNPFYLFGRYDPNPGSYVIKFHHLPAKCTISIYNLSGELMRTIEKDDATTNEASWDVLTANGLPVASGIYIWVVDAPGFGQKVGKMAVFVQQEVLNIY